MSDSAEDMAMNLVGRGRWPNDSDDDSASDLLSPGQRWQQLVQRRNVKFRCTVHLFGGVDNVRLIRRHRLNRRRLDQHMRNFKDGILSMGVLDSATRATLVLIPEGVDTSIDGQFGAEQMYGVICGATLCDAIYLAIEEEPCNPHCVDLRNNGVPNAIILDKNTTDDEIELVKQLHNASFFLLRAQRLPSRQQQA